MRSILTKMAVAGSVLLAALQMGGCAGEKKDAHASKKNADSTVVKVVVTTLKDTLFEDWGSYSADLRGSSDAYLTAPFQGGRVNSIKSVGTRVRAGQALCDIDSAKYEAALQAAKASVEYAQGELERTQANVDKGSLGKSVLSQVTMGFQNARMGLASAQRAYEDCRCEAPFDGMLVSRSIENYQTVAPGSPTMRLSRMDKLEAILSIPETEAFSYTEGMKAEFRLLQNAQRAYSGKIKSIDKAIDARTRTVSARIELANGDGSLKPGMVGRANILRKKHDSAIVIPTTALLRLEKGVSVMVVENGIAQQREINVAATQGNSALISEGLRAGDLLVVSGAFQISSGTKVSY